PSMTTLVSSSADNTSSYGQAVTFTATVSAIIPGSGIPTVGVELFDSTTNTYLGTRNLSGGSASLTTTALAAGVNVITATYRGDPNFASSGSSNNVTLTVTHAPSRTTLASSSANNTSSYGQAVTFTATVSALIPGLGIP